MTDANSGTQGPWSSRGVRWTVAALLFVVAAIPRFYDLDRLSLYEDEPLTALSAAAVLEGRGASMPSGMPYLRARAFTMANAAVVAVRGADRDGSYRIVSAFFGTLTPPALFLTGTAFVSPPAAFVAGSMLALSEWHVARSRMARMYPPFLFFFVLTGFFFWRWATSGGNWNLVLAVGLLAGTVSLHLLGLFAAFFALIPLVLPRRVVPSPLLLLGVALGMTGLAYLMERRFVAGAFESLRGLGDVQLDGTAVRAAGPDVATLDPAPLLLGIGAALGVWLGWRVVASVERPGDLQGWLARAAWLGAATAAGAFAGAGHLWGATLAGLLLLLMVPAPLGRLARSAWLPAMVLAVGSAAWALYSVRTLGVYPGIRRISDYPFPYLAFFWFQFPGLVALFVGVVIWLVLSATKRREAGLVTAVAFVLLTMAAVGMLQAWGGTRYLFHAYPYMLLVGAAVLVEGGRWLSGRLSLRRPDLVGLGLALVVALSGATGGHGVASAARMATLDHGEPVNQYVHGMPFRPDHRGPGQFVRDRLGDDDLVIAEDVEAYFYVGRVDYWFRRSGDARRYLYLAADGVPRDVYVSSAHLPTPASVAEVVSSARGQAWFLTSGETAWQRDWYLSDEQRMWLDSLEASATPAFVGEDGVTSVYCLNC